jgi:hypothetical protein
METMKRREAVELNLPTYFTGKYCKNGHLSERFTKSGCCIECRKYYSKTRYANEKEAMDINTARWIENNLERHKEYQREYQREYRKKHREKLNAYGREYRKKKNKEKKNESK